MVEREPFEGTLHELAVELSARLGRPVSYWAVANLTRAFQALGFASKVGFAPGSSGKQRAVWRIDVWRLS